MLISVLLVVIIVLLGALIHTVNHLAKGFDAILVCLDIKFRNLEDGKNVVQSLERIYSHFLEILEAGSWKK